ncbi:hypothetical protein MVEN_02217600 [Mycena venus]|uniref:Uncharacterized protein n=1 Tax=Mycena venus TaxID=2733690 RepID=A0A8H6X6Y4_9AGAR|nr:hypothetical protein MVEN_02217600 [Mycena venus]
MPALKRKACVKNLGSLAKKKKKLADSPTTELEPTCPSSPEDSEVSSNDMQIDLTTSDCASTVSLENSDLSEALGDVPAFESENSLLAWLDVGKRRLQKILERKQPEVKDKCRGPYYNTKIGAAPAPQTVRLKKAEERKVMEAHGSGLSSWLRKPSQQRQPAVDLGRERSQAVDRMQIDDQTADGTTPTLPRLTANPQEIDEEETHRSESPTPSELSRLEEDGLGDFEEIFATVSATAGQSPDPPTVSPAVTSAMPMPSPANPAGPRPSVQFGPPLFSCADDTFFPAEKIPAGTPPCPKQIDKAIEKLHAFLRPSRGPNTKGYKHAALNMVLRGWLELMLSFLRLYAAEGYTEWGKKADIIAKSAGNGTWMLRQLREWSIASIKDDTNLPTSKYGKFNGSVLEDEDLAQEIHMHLQGLGPYIAVQDVVNYMSSDEMKTQLNLKNGISLQTAQWHECDDVVHYRQNIFLPRWVMYDKHTRKWTRKGGDIAESSNAATGGDAPQKKSKQQVEGEKWEEWEEEPQRSFVGIPDGKVIVIWRHDECIFYGNDHRKIRWVHSSEMVKPRKKGEGHSMMVIAFVLPDYGWEARLMMKPGKTRDGYYGNKEILEHTTMMMDRLDATRPDEIHVLAYNNATIHTARAPDALSAHHMVVKPPGINSKTGVQQNFLVKTKGPDGSEMQVQMHDATFVDGTPQALYFPEGHPKAGIFKGMRNLIHE